MTIKTNGESFWAITISATRSTSMATTAIAIASSRVLRRQQLPTVGYYTEQDGALPAPERKHPAFLLIHGLTFA
jgi:hypothetical protein